MASMRKVFFAAVSTAVAFTLVVSSATATDATTGTNDPVSITIARADPPLPPSVLAFREALVRDLLGRTAPELRGLPKDAPTLKDREGVVRRALPFASRARV